MSAEPGGSSPSRITRLVTDLEVAGLGRCERLEQAAVGLEIDQRRAVEAVQAAHQQHRPLDLDELHDRRADRIGPHRRAQRENATGIAVAARTLQHKIAPRLVQPVEHFQALELADAVEALVPRLEDFYAAGRAVGPALPRTLQPVGPWRSDAADEIELSVSGRRRLDRDLARADLVQAHHGSAVEADHDVRGLDDGIGLLACLQAELVDRLVGDRGRDDGPVDVETDMGGGGALLDLDDPALEAVSGADLHGRPLSQWRYIDRDAAPLEQAKAEISTA